MEKAGSSKTSDQFYKTTPCHVR